MRSANIWVNKTFAGTLVETNEGEFIFQYIENYWYNNIHPVSLTLPIVSEPYHSKTLFPFFDGLIPEGWLLDIGIKNWKINPNDRFGLLLHLCQDCIGNVSIIANEEPS